ncbi:MAG: hypothetical protein IKC04_00630 [Oscillospiraceae bacterium]|nr:hypothetical protein [Oscillospiraceae bacterium]
MVGKECVIPTLAVIFTKGDADKIDFLLAKPILMRHRFGRYEVMLRIMMLLAMLAMMRCLPMISGKADIISEGNNNRSSDIICRRQTSLQNKRTTQKGGAFILSMGYKKDIFAVFAYEFELSQFLVKYRLTPK